MTELKPCPFCGGEDIDPEGVFAEDQNGKNYTYPSCNDCDASCTDWNTRAGVTDEEKKESLKALELLYNLATSPSGYFVYEDSFLDKLENSYETIRKLLTC